MPFRVIVCGGRKFLNRDLMVKVLDGLLERHPDLMIIHGGCSGADAGAHAWCKIREVPETVYYAKWSSLGDVAGPIRNRQMAEAGADGCIAFPGHKGTADMVRCATARGIPVWEVR